MFIPCFQLSLLLLLILLLLSPFFEKEELTKRDERIAMLEDALRESVSIAAEREELLAQHVEFSEEAAKSMRELETDTDKLTMEKGITNIKNAFLILSLAERDTLLASLKAMRKRNMEELMNIRCVKTDVIYSLFFLCQYSGNLYNRNRFYF